ncbi:MAG TPA: response regulator transcription factor [Conexibacter sp.]|nr:response regulator transcription factor [Conexibacter sp.]
MAPEPIRVLLVDDHDVFRRGLAQLLAAEGIDVVAEASGGEAGVRLAAELAPDVVLMDLSMPGMSGVEATRAIAADGDGGPAVVVLTLSDDDGSMLEALLAGAAGYVLKEAALEQIVAAVQAAAAGDAVIPPRVAPELLRRLRDAGSAGGGGDAVELSARELEVLRLIVEGRDNAAIAAELFISPNTVKSHVASIFAKLGVESRLQASVQALRRGIVR